MSEQTGTGSGKIAAGPAAVPPAANTKGQMGEPSGSAGAPIAVHASDVARDAKARGEALVSDAKDHVTSLAQDQKDAIAERLEDVAAAVHRSGEQLEGHQDWIAGLVERGADELGSLASTLRSNDLKSLLGNLEDLSRRQPAVFLGAAMAAGFAAVRLGKVAAAGMSRADLPTLREVGRERD